MELELAPEGCVFVCTACGKRSKDIYGDQSINWGWDISCSINAKLFKESELVIEDGLVVRVKPESA